MIQLEYERYRNTSQRDVIAQRVGVRRSFRETFTQILLVPLLMYCLPSHTAAAEPEGVVYASVGRLEAIERIDQSSIMPWKQKPQCPGCEIIVTNGCGMAEARYWGGLLHVEDIDRAPPAYFDESSIQPEWITLRVPVGEFCSMLRYEFSVGTVIRLAKWRGALYYLDDAETFYTRIDRESSENVEWTVDDFIADQSFLRGAGALHLVKDIRVLDPRDSNACYHVDTRIPDRLDGSDYEWFENGEHLCIKRGVYVDDLVKWQADQE